jgi:hypothetical protein
MTIANAWINIYTVLHENVMDVNDNRIGYVALSGFIMTSLVELDTAFSRFNQEGIDELVLDLRYNRGGRLAVAQYLAGLIAGDHADGMVFQKFDHNDKHLSWDFVIRFFKPTNALNLNRLVVLTTRATASASEALINGLQPFVDVVIIGGTTHGKPVGMYGHDFCDKRINPIEFRISNVLDLSDYFNGISPYCTSEDDLNRPFGDPEEGSLKEALAYIINGECSAGHSYRTAKTPFQKAARQQKRIHLRGFRAEVGAF